MKEVIKKIEEVCDVKISENYSEGYKITTNAQKILLLIDNTQYCCEDFGYMSSEDNFEDFIGAEIIDIRNIDRGFSTSLLNKTGATNAEFLSIETNKGLLQFAVYNEHNGYYGHSVYIQFYDNTIETTL